MTLWEEDGGSYCHENLGCWQQWVGGVNAMTLLSTLFDQTNQNNKGSCTRVQLVADDTTLKLAKVDSEAH